MTKDKMITELEDKFQTAQGERLRLAGELEMLKKEREWRPIESAPKTDGQTFLAIMDKTYLDSEREPCRIRKVVFACWDEQENNYMQCDYQANCGYDVDEYLTYWMPLNLPPLPTT